MSERRAHLSLRLAIASLLAASCAGAGAGVAASGASSGAGGLFASSSSSSSGSGSGSGGSVQKTGECQTDADCAGASCVDLTPGGYRVCRGVPEPIATCAPGEMGCCNSDGCPPGQRCFPPVGYCGGLVGPMNRCLGDACQSDGDCDGGVCALAGELGLFVNTCLAASACRADADCTEKPGGVCRPIEDACCNDVYALFCWYPEDCTSKADCNGNACGDPATGRAICATQKPVCPT